MQRDPDFRGPRASARLVPTAPAVGDGRSSGTLADNTARCLPTSRPPRECALSQGYGGGPGSPGQTTDRDLVWRAREGDALAVEALCDRYIGKLYDLLLRTTRDRSAASALARGTLTQAIAEVTAEGADLPATVSVVVYRVAQNLAVRWLENTGALRRGRALSEPESQALGLDIVDPVWAIAPSQATADREAARRVWAAAMELAPWQYLLLDLRHRQGLTNDETATTFGTSPASLLPPLLDAEQRLNAASVRRGVAEGSGTLAPLDLFAALRMVSLPIELRHSVSQEIVVPWQAGHRPKHFAPEPGPTTLETSDARPERGAEPGTTSASVASPAAESLLRRTEDARIEADAQPVRRPASAPARQEESPPPALMTRPVRLRIPGETSRFVTIVRIAVLLLLGLLVGLVLNGTIDLAILWRAIVG